MSNEYLRVLSLQTACSMKERGADSERKGKLKMEDLKINTVVNMHYEQKSTSKRRCVLIKERTRNVTDQGVQGNSQSPQAQVAHQQVQVQETQTTTSSRKIQRSSKIRDTYWTKTSTSSLIDD